MEICGRGAGPGAEVRRVQTPAGASPGLGRLGLASRFSRWVPASHPQGNGTPLQMGRAPFLPSAEAASWPV